MHYTMLHIMFGRVKLIGSTVPRTTALLMLTGYKQHTLKTNQAEVDVDSESVHGGNLDGLSSYHPGMLLHQIILNVFPGILTSIAAMHTTTSEIKW